MQQLAPLLQQRGVSHLQCQRVLEGVLHLGKRWLLVDELSRLEVEQKRL
jgi:hypothetical protein